MSISLLPCCTVLSIGYAGFIGIVSYYFLKFRYEKKWTRKRKSLMAILFILIFIPPIVFGGVVYDSYTKAVDIKRYYRNDLERNAIDVAEHYDYVTVIKSKNWGMYPGPTQIDTKAIKDAESEALEFRTLGIVSIHMSYRANVQSVNRLICNFSSENITIINGNLTPILVVKIYTSRTFLAIMDNGSMRGFTYSNKLYSSGKIDINGSYLVDMTLSAPYEGGGRTLRQSVFIDQDNKVQFFIIWKPRLSMA
jgi:hypothetical protein